MIADFLENKALLESLRLEIERQYKEALNALEVLGSYFTARSPAANPALALTTVRATAAARARGETQVSRVLAAIQHEFKTAERLAADLGLSEEAVRAVLYSKFVQSRLLKKRLGKKVAFRIKATAPDDKPAAKSDSVAGLVKHVIESHPKGISTADITAALKDKVGEKKAAIGAALHNMKKRGRISHNELLGLYFPSSYGGQQE